MSEQSITAAAAPEAPWVERPAFQRTILAVIAINAITLGLQTSPDLVEHWGGLLQFVDAACLLVFVLELVLRIATQRGAFFKSGWNLFDFIVIAVSLLPAGGVLSVLRVLRVLRLLRAVTLVPSLRIVVEGLVSALPGMGSVSLLLALVTYVGAVLVTTLYGQQAPLIFGSMDRSVFALLQVMTLDGWPDQARAAMKTNPHAWIFFVGFIIVSTFTVLNLFVGVMVTAIEERVALEKARNGEREPEIADVLAAVADLKAQLAAMQAQAQSGVPARRD